MKFTKRLSIINKFIHQHPIAKKNRMKTLWRFIKWQISYRLDPGPKIVKFIEGSKLYVEPHMTGATGNIYAGLSDFEDMAFLLHFLDGKSLFCDVGSNVGVYTILASAVKNAETYAIEASPETFKKLLKNIEINNISHRVNAVNFGVGKEEGLLNFTRGHDTVNHIVPGKGTDANSIQIAVKPLPSILGERVPDLIKIDVEGFEWMVLQGAIEMLRNEKLQALIIELNGSGGRYGIKDEMVDDLLSSAGFFPVGYAPFDRKLVKLKTFNRQNNTIYIKDNDLVARRLTTATKFRVLGMSI